MLYRSTDDLCRCGAAVKNLAHSASFQSLENNAPSNPGIKHLERVAAFRAPFRYFAKGGVALVVFIRLDRQSRGGAAMASLVALQCQSRLPPVVEAPLYRLATNRNMMT
jgi:hypothetical protein